MTRVAALVEPPARAADRGRPARPARSRSATATFPAGSYVIKRDQPYGRLAKNLLERQSYSRIPNLRTYDDSGWTMGLAMLVDVKEIKDKAILDVPTTPVNEAAAEGQGHAAPARPAWPSRTTARTT